jgi:ribonuclease HII
VVVGLDECGYGSLSGPLVIGAAAFNLVDGWRDDLPCPIPGGIKDSKAYTSERAREVAALCASRAPSFLTKQLGVVTAQEINEHGVTWGLKTGFLRALHPIELMLGRIDLCLVDGLRPMEWDGEQKCLPKADSLWWPVSAASVFAKVWRDLEMTVLAKEYPHYGFERNKGYGAPFHLEALRTHGPCPQHRTQYVKTALSKPVKEKA